jgi:hypothetical protein
MMNETYCTAMKLDGTPCKAKRLAGKPFCTFHDPDLQEVRREGRKLGGKVRNARSVTLPPETPDASLTTVQDVTHFLAVTVNAVLKGKVDCRVGNCVAALVGQLLRSLESGGLEDRLQQLENLLSGKHNRRTA